MKMEGIFQLFCFLRMAIFNLGEDIELLSKDAELNREFGKMAVFENLSL